MPYIPILFAILNLIAQYSNLAKAIGFLAIIFIFLRPIRKEDVLLFLCSNLFFVLNDYLAIRANFFRFTKPDLLQLPYWEFFAWGTWLLLGTRLLPKVYPSKWNTKFILGAIVFTASFALIQNRILLLAFSSTLLILSLLGSRSRTDFKFTIFFALLGVLVEWAGISFDLWLYPNANTELAAAQFVIMWAGVGFYFRYILGPLLTNQDHSANPT